MIDFKMIPPGAVILHHTKRRAFVPWAIRLWTKGWTNHASLYMGSGRHEIIEATWPRVRRTTLETYCNTDSAFKIYFKANLSVLDLAQIKGYAYGSIGKRYDLQGLFSFVFKWPANEHQNFCSELVAEAFNSVGITTSFETSDKTSPADLERYMVSQEGKERGWAKIMDN